MRKSIVFVLLISSCALAQPDRVHPRLTGVLSNDLFSYHPPSTLRDSLANVQTRSALTAGFFSLVIPGSGQIYNGGTPNYLKAAGFLALEAAGWVVNVVWTKKAVDQTNFFQTYADGTANYALPGGQSDPYGNGHYSVLRYAQWIQQNYQEFINNGINIGGGQTPTQVLDPTTVEKYAPLLVVNGGTPAPWSQVNWEALNKVEAALGGYFSHLLPPHGNQQYYELIGKYPQFRQGWYDENLSYIAYDQLVNDTRNSYYYMQQRGDANNMYSIASTALAVVIANHFVSAVEAALWAHANQKRIETKVGMSPLPNNLGYQTEVNVSFRF